MLLRINRRVLKPLSSRMFTVPAKLQIEDTDIMTYVLAQLDDATEHLDTIKFSKLSENWYSLFRNCHSVIKFNLPIKKDNGRNMMVETYLAQHRCYISPYNCRMRITPEINIRKLEALAIQVLQAVSLQTVHPAVPLCSPAASGRPANPLTLRRSTKPKPL